MAENPEDTAEQQETEAEDAEDVSVDEEVVLDLESATEYEQRIETLEATVEEQREQIEELNDLLLDLSTRVADGNDIGVCPDCHGPVVRINRWIRANTIECTDCGRVFHEY